MAERIDIENIQRLEYADDYVGLESYIQLNYVETCKVGYHMVHKPITRDDSIPQKVKHIRDGRLRANIYTPDFIAQRAQENDEQKERLVGEYGLSNFEDPHQLANVLGNQFQKRNEEYKQRIGTFIVKLNLEEGDGLIGPVGDYGHFEFLPYKGFTIDTRIDEQFGYQPYEDFLIDDAE